MRFYRKVIAGRVRFGNKTRIIRRVTKAEERHRPESKRLRHAIYRYKRARVFDGKFVLISGKFSLSCNRKVPLVINFVYTADLATFVCLHLIVSPEVGIVW